MCTNSSFEAVKLFHSMLVSYELALKDILGSGQAVFVQPVLANFAKLNEASGVLLFQSKGIDETFQNLSKIFKSAGLLQDFHFEKLDVNKYLVHVKGCSWAPLVHDKLSPRGFPCPYALMAMSIFQSKTREKVKFVASEFLEDGSKTLIELFSF
jgi:hypothetical protein